MSEPEKKPRAPRLSLVPKKAPRAARKPRLRVVGGPDLEALARVVAEAASQHAPMTSRAVALRNDQQMRLNQLTGERQDYEDRKTLLTGQYNAVLNAMNTHVADIDAAIAVIRDGIGVAQAQAQLEPTKPGD